MPERLERAKRYRHHAEQLRTMARDWRDATTLQKVSELARDYDRMAADLERSAGADRHDDGRPDDLRPAGKN